MLHGMPLFRLINPVDGENIVAIVKRLRAFWQNPKLDPLGPSEFTPGPQFKTDDEILDKLRTNHAIFRSTLAHPSGTYAMIPERLSGCVAPDVKVHGVRGLRVVDASVMPIIPGGALRGTVYAVQC